MSTSTTTEPSVEEVEGYNTDALITFLNGKNFGLNENKIQIIRDQGIDGASFLMLNEESLTFVRLVCYSTDVFQHNYFRSIYYSFLCFACLLYNHIIPNTYLFLCFSFLLLIVKPAQKTHSRYRRSTWC
ncbi:hypothetical protein RclHR1_27590005 [Rhizophagus clarus]|uniref:Uncharacterized protein n=1 Tax=Rhizophagus clarus TaxID=94130 RepID=A0A2Z6RWP9_9GLOM|nr:hypothetical protein RclHR1_27590005 [Rhizophagus clarus]